MSLGTLYITNLVPHLEDNGVMRQISYAEAAERHGAENLRTATEDFSIHWNGALVQFHRGIAVPVDAGLAAALDAADAPVI